MSLKNYVTQLADMTSSMMKEKGFRHPAALLRDYGRTMAFDAQTFAGARGRVHECYKNAGKLALDGDGTYCEGYVSVHGVPLGNENELVSLAERYNTSSEVANVVQQVRSFLSAWIDKADLPTPRTILYWVAFPQGRSSEQRARPGSGKGTLGIHHPEQSH